MNTYTYSHLINFINMSKVHIEGKMTSLTNDVEKMGDLHRGWEPELPSHSVHNLIPKD